MNLAVLLAAAASFADAPLSVQFDAKELSAAGCPGFAAAARQAGAGSVQLERCEFYLDGERRASELKSLADEIAYFERAGFSVAVWMTTLGYGRMTDPDFLRRFPGYRPLRSFDGKTSAVCTTDAAWRAAVADDVRDFIRAGAKTILFDDDLVQCCRPGVCCVCDEHLRRIAARLGADAVTPGQVREAYTGEPNPLRSACMDEMGASLMEFCRAMRAAADEVDPSVVLATCLSISEYDLDGVDVPQMVRLLAGKGASRPFVRMSGATYWVCDPKNQRNWGQGLGGVLEYIRWQSALLRAEGIVPLDENDPYPRDIDVVPEGLCEAYDRAVIAEGGIVRNKYILRRNLNSGAGVDPEYLEAHLSGMKDAGEIAAAFDGATPVGFEVFSPRHMVRGATLPSPFMGRNAMLKFFAQPQSGILLAANGVPTRYDCDSGAPLAAFGPAAAQLPLEWLRRGVVLDRDGAAILEERGVDTGSGAQDKSRRVGEWRLYENASGGRFAVCDRSWYDMDGRAASPTPVPADEAWRFFTGGEIPVRLVGAKGVHLLAKRRRDGSLAVLLNNTSGAPSGPFTVVVGGVPRTVDIPGYSFRLLD